MKNISPLAKKVASRKLLASLFLVLAAGTIAHADTYTWTNGFGDNFWEDANWSGGTGTFPNSVGAIANATSSSSVATSGVIKVSGTDFGGNPVSDTLGVLNIGDASGTLQYTIQEVSPGVLTFDNGGAGAAINELSTKSGAGDSIAAPLVMNDNLTITNSGSIALTISGGITGASGKNLNIVLNGPGASTTGAINFASAQINNSGAITLSGTGSAPVSIAGGIGSNVTSITSNATNSTLTISGTAIFVNSAGTTINNNTAKVITISGGVGGTGNLILNNNGTGAGGITISGALAVNNTGTIVNSGLGAGTVTISSSIGASVNGLTQNSTTSALTVSGSNTYTGQTLVQAGTLNFTVNASLGASTTDVLVGGTTGSASASLLGNGTSWSRNVTVQSGNTGVATVGQNAGTNSTVSGSITLGNGAVGHGVTLVASTSGTENFSGVIADGGSVTSGKGVVTIASAGGTVELSGTNTFGGGVTLASGFVSLNNAAAAGTGTITTNGGNFSQVGGAAVTLSTNNALVLNTDLSYAGTTGSNLNLGTGNVDLGAFLNTTGTTTRTINVASQTLTIGGTISNGSAGQVNSITKAGVGTLILNGANNATGGTTVNGGVLQLGGTQTGSVTINNGGTLNSAGLFSTVTGWLGSGVINTGSTGAIALTGNSSENINFGSYSNLMLGASSNSIYTGTITPGANGYHLGGGGATLTLSGSNALSGANNLTVGAVTLLGPVAGTSTGTVAISNGNSLSGTTTVNAGTLNLATTTGALGSSDVIVNSSILAIDNSGGATPSGSITRANSVALNGSTMTVTGTNAGSSHDVIANALSFNSGYSTLTVTPTGSTNTAISAGSLSTTGYGFVNGTNLGKAAPGATNNGGGNITFTSAPTVNNGVTWSGGINTGQLNTGILANLVGEVATTTGTSSGTATGTPNTFVTYDMTNGLRPLSTGEYATSLISGDNVRLTATSTITTSTSINSLIFASGVSANPNAGTVLTDASGAVLFVGSGTIGGAASTGTFELGNAQGVFSVNNGQTGTVNSVLDGTNGLVKLGAGGLTLSGTNTYSGTTSILAGTATMTNLSSFGTGTSAILLGDVVGSNNVTLGINAGSSMALSRNLTLQGGNSGTVTLANSAGGNFSVATFSGTITLGSNGVGHNLNVTSNQYNTVALTGSIVDPSGLAGSGGVVIYGGGGTDSVSGNNTYSGGTIINGSTVNLSTNTAFGTGTLTINGGGIGGNNRIITNAVVVNSNFTGTGATNTLRFSNTFTLNKSIAITGLGNNSIIIDGVIADSTPGSNYGIALGLGDYAETTTLNGANTFDGGITLSSGSNTSGGTAGIQIGNLGTSALASALGTGTLTLNQSTGTQLHTNTILNGFGSGVLTTNNAEVWNGDLTYGSANLLDMGTGAVSLGNSAATTRTVTVSSSGGAFEVDGVISNGTNFTTPTTSLTKAGAGALILGGTNAYTGATIVSAGYLQLGNGGTSGSIASSTGTSVLLSSATSTLSIDRSDSFTLGSSIIGNGGNITGTGAFIQAGTGTITINNALAYTGTTTIIGGGTLRVSAPTGSLASSALFLSNNGGKFVYDSTGSSGTTAQTFATLSATGGDSSITNIYGSGGTSTLTFTNAIARNLGATVNFVDNGTTSNEIIINKIGGTNVAAQTVLDKGYFFNGSSYATSDSGTYIRAYNYNTDANAVIVTSAGTTALANNAANNVQMNGNVTNQTGASINTLNITGTNSLTLATGSNSLTVPGILKTGGGIATISTTSGGTGTINLGGSEGVIRTDLATDVLVINSNVNGASLTKTGNGVLTLAGTNSYNSNTYLDAGTVNINSNSALGSGTSLVTINSGVTIDNTSGSAITMNTNHSLSLAGDFTFGGSNALNLGSGSVSLGGNDGLMRTITVNGTGTLTIAGNISNGNNAIIPTSGIDKAGAGTLTLSGSSVYTGGTVVDGGTLIVTGGSYNNSATLQGATSVNGTNTLTGMASTAGLYVGETVIGGNFNAGSTITAITSSTSITVNSSATAGGATYVQFGNNYSSLGLGNVSVRNGTLLLNGSTQLGSAVAIGNGTGVATLAGSGTVFGPLSTVSAGSNIAHVAPGATPATAGTLTVGNLGFTVGAGTNFDFDLNTANTVGAGTNDLIAMTGGTLTFGGATTFNFDVLSSLTTGVAYTLVNGASTINGFNASNFSATGLGSLSATFSTSGGALLVTFTAAGVPPTAYFTGTTNSDMTSAANYVSGPSGGTIVGAPGSTTDVFVTANTGVTGPSATTLDTNTSALTINSLTFTGAGTPAASGATISGSNALTINAASGTGITVQTGSGNSTISAPIVLGNSQTWMVTDAATTLAVSGNISGAGKALTKTGAGTLALSGANTYSGGTEIAVGKLTVTNTTGSATGTGTFKLDSGATLSGTGKIASTTNTINGTVQAGFDGTSASTTGSLTLTSSGTTTFAGAGLNLQFNLSATTPGTGTSINVGTSAVAFGTGLTLTLNLIGSTTTEIPTGSDDYILFAGTSGVQYSGLQTDGQGHITNFSNLVITGTTFGEANNLRYGLTYLYLNGNNIDVVVVPEPGTWVLMLAGLVGLALVHRARRRNT